MRLFWQKKISIQSSVIKSWSNLISLAFPSKSTWLKKKWYFWYQRPLWAFKMLCSLETYFLASYLWVKSMHFPCLVPSKQSRRANTTIEKKIFPKRKWKVLESHLFGFWHPKKRNHICSSKKGRPEKDIFTVSLQLFAGDLQTQNGQEELQRGLFLGSWTPSRMDNHALNLCIYRPLSGKIQ